MTSQAHRDRILFDLLVNPTSDTVSFARPYSGGEELALSILREFSGRPPNHSQREINFRTVFITSYIDSGSFISVRQMRVPLTANVWTDGQGIWLETLFFFQRAPFPIWFVFDLFVLRRIPGILCSLFSFWFRRIVFVSKREKSLVPDPFRNLSSLSHR